MKEALLVGAGGFLGSIMRYGLGRWAAAMAPGFPIPAGTLLVNVAGCFVIGLLFRLAEAQQWPGAWRWFLFTGILGGFTTFSAFGLETFNLLRAGQTGPALLNIAAQLLLGLGAVWAGYALGRLA